MINTHTLSKWLSTPWFICTLILEGLLPRLRRNELWAIMDVDVRYHESDTLVQEELVSQHRAEPAGPLRKINTQMPDASRSPLSTPLLLAEY